MALPEATQATSSRLRLWPGVLAVAVLWLGKLVLPMTVDGGAVYGLLLGVAGGAIVLLWWLFLSRAPLRERLGVPLVLAAVLLATSRLVHESVATGMMGMMLPLLAMPILALGLVVWAVVSGHMAPARRWGALTATALLACGGFTLVRTGGITGDAQPDFHWRWSQTPEQRLLSRAADEPLVPPIPQAAAAPPAERAPVASVPSGPSGPFVAPTTGTLSPSTSPSTSPSISLPASLPTTPGAATAAPPTTVHHGTRWSDTAEWTGFRGPRRNGVVHAVRIATDWTSTPPTQLWRRAVGPGWSSFAVNRGLIYTQEQRGDDELVSAYDVDTGAPVWRHRDAVRFWESNAGAGPRATPTVAGVHVYAFGATGVLNALDARTGAPIWSRNVSTDTGVEVPGWGFASSPLVVDDMIVVAASGTLSAYDRATGRPRWSQPANGWGYSSPHLTSIDGTQQIVLLSGGGATGFSVSGARLWEYRGTGGSIVQPAVTEDGRILIAPIDSSASGIGVRAIAVTRAGDRWTVEEQWASQGLKPSFNDLVVHAGHAFGFDGSILACLNLLDGARCWKGGRYGHGQMLLLAEQGVLLVLSEDGDLALVSAASDRFRELARVPALTGKTWNHPVLVGDVLLVRNGEEMAAFRLPSMRPADAASADPR